jgi:hypothetical protein
VKPLLPALSIFAVLACASCATMDDAAVADGSPIVVKDDYDGSTIVRQPLVSAGAGDWADWTMLGFEWRSKFPNVVVLTAGTKGVVRIVDVAFEIDGEPMERVRAVSELTDYGDDSAPVRWSTRRFEVGWEEFLTIAGAKSVRMRVIGPNEAAATSFGSAHPGALVNARLGPFVRAVRKQRGEETH